MKLLRIGNSNFEKLFKNPDFLQKLSEFINEFKNLSNYSKVENDYFDYKRIIPVGIPSTENA